MSILKLKPIFKDYIWGGDNLVKNFGKEYDGEILAESWELSSHQDGSSIIDNGDFYGKSFSQFLSESKDNIIGENYENSSDFPVLIKFIDAKQSLSIQVHPDDEYARKNENDNGKNEMWYIVDATKDAYIYYGFNKEISKAEYESHIENNTLLEVLNKVNVKKGDCFFIKAGTVHAIGEGCLIAEVQQSSNVTYRVYDYARRDANGNLRELHIKKAIEVSTLAPAKNIAKTDDILVECEHFTVEKIVLDGEKKFFANEKSFHSLLVLSGSGEIKSHHQTIEFSKGDSIFVCANTGEYSLSGQFTALLTHI